MALQLFNKTAVELQQLEMYYLSGYTNGPSRGLEISSLCIYSILN